MTQQITGRALLLLAFFAACGCSAPQVPATPEAKSYAVYAEFAKGSNVAMKGGLNRRVFNTTEIEHGSRIRLASDGSITLQPGTYRLTGLSIVTMQSTFAPPVPKNNNNYPGYCLVYYKEFEANEVLKHQIVTGTPGTALDTSPSEFDAILTVDKETHICVGHQSGEQLNNEVFLSVYDVAGITSPYHVFARITVTEL